MNRCIAKPPKPQAPDFKAAATLAESTETSITCPFHTAWPHCGPCSVQRRRAITNKHPASPQSSNLRVGPQLPFHVVTAGPENDAGSAARLKLGETFAQLLASACEGHRLAADTSTSASWPFEMSRL